MNKNKIAVGLALAGGTALLFASLAGAQTSSSAASGSASSHQRWAVQIGPGGRALLRGTLVSVSASSLTVQSWGGNWIVNVSADAEVLPRVSGNSSDLSAFAAGDLVGVNGVADENSAWTINASVVRDWTERRMQHTNASAAIQIEATGRAEGEGRTFEGTASAVSASSFTLTVGGQVSYTVNVSASTKVLNRNWLNLGLSAIQNGNDVRVFGTANGTSTGSSIDAQVVRDVSLPLSLPLGY